MVQRHRPESADMLAVGQLILIHQPEWPRESLAECDAARGQPFGQSFREIFQDFSTPGQLLAVCGLFTGGKDGGLSLSEVRFDGSAEMFRSHRRMLFHAADVKQGQCQLGECVNDGRASP